MTLGELVQRAGQWAGVNHGRGRPVIPLPNWVGWLQALAMEMAPGEPLMSRDNLASMQVDNIATGQWPGFQALDIAPASAAGIGPTYLGRKGPRSRLDGWRAQAGR
jgi:NADH dehydrogenase